jgi:hypothetical protein
MSIKAIRKTALLTGQKTTTTIPEELMCFLRRLCQYPPCNTSHLKQQTSPKT